MKKFFMTSPFQPVNPCSYEPMDNTKLRFEKETAFPLMHLINGYAEENEEIEVYVVQADYQNARDNFDKFADELKALCEEKNIRCKPQIIDVPYDSSIDAQLIIFEKIIEKTADDDILYGCITYGFKPMPMVMMMAFNYAHRIHQNVIVDCLVYGQVEFRSRKAQIFDITSLLYMDEITRLMAEQKVSDPMKQIRMLLGMDEKGEADDT